MLSKYLPKQAGQAVPVLLSLLAVFVIALAGIAACSESSSEQTVMPPVASETVVVTPSSPVPNDDPNIRGFVTRITTSAESTEILVEYFCPEGASPEYPYDKVLVKLDGNTAVDSDNGTIVNIGSLTVGSTVEVWFSEPSAESYPVLAYGQAVRLITSGDPMNGMTGLPRLAVIGSSKSLAGPLDVDWPSRGYDFSRTMSEMLDSTRGAHITAEPGKALTLNFSSNPKAFTAYRAESQNYYSPKYEIEVGENNEIIVPENASGELFIYVNASWERGTMVYGFAVSIVEPN
ncbi:MAG: hypothetical protein E7554_01145 [Ruminococcaceae bacterium]|nr:hypothetical protein [Oscillospiraceae bacterium]